MIRSENHMISRATICTLALGFWLALGVASGWAADGDKKHETEVAELKAKIAALTKSNLDLNRQVEDLKQMVAGLDKNFAKAAPEQRAKIATAKANGCIANLKQIDGALRQWALEKKKKPDDQPVVGEVLEYLLGNRWPFCPLAGTYSLGETVKDTPTCSCPEHKLVAGREGPL